jgi:hypothetical protein
VQKKIEEKAATTQFSNQELGEVYNEKSGAYSIKLPKGWEIEQGEESTDSTEFPKVKSDLTAFPKESTGDLATTTIISFDKAPAGETLASFATKEVGAINSEQGAVKSEKDVSINGVKGHEIMGTEKSDGDVFETYTILFLKDGTAYRLVYAAPPDRYDNYATLFKQSAQTFTITK